MASVTLTFSAAQATRIQDAFTRRLNPVDGSGDPRAANLADFKEWLVEATRKVVIQEERQAANEALTDTDVDIT
jgi:hypothetical protein